MMNWRRKWKEAVVTTLSISLQHLPEGTEESNENPQDSRSLDRVSIPYLPDTKQES
jgi:hypothetical protein